MTAEARSGPDGAPLTASSSGGFELDVDGDRRVTLVLRELADEALYSVVSSLAAGRRPGCRRHAGRVSECQTLQNSRQ